MSATHVHNNRLGPPRIMPSATASNSTTVISLTSSASISEQCEQIISILWKELERGLAVAQMEQREGSMGGEDNEDATSDTQKTHNDDHFEVYWDGHDDPENPQNWALWKRICIVVGVSFQTAMV